MKAKVFLPALEATNSRRREASIARACFVGQRYARSACQRALGICKPPAVSTRRRLRRGVVRSRDFDRARKHVRQERKDCAIAMRATCVVWRLQSKAAASRHGKFLEGDFRGVRGRASALGRFTPKWRLGWVGDFSGRISESGIIQQLRRIYSSRMPHLTA